MIPPRMSLRVALGGLAGATLLGGYALDTALEGERLNRSIRALGATAYTLIQYKLVFPYTEKPITQIHRDVANAWLATARKNGGMYAKLAQSVSSMNRLLPTEYLEVLGVMKDRAPTEPWSAIERLLREEYAGAIPFKSIEHEAVASASIAQVHVAILADGTKVAVKIQKPRIAKQIDNDLFMFRVVTTLLDRLFELPLSWMAPYIVEQLRKETNFVNEADNGERADRLAKSDPVLSRYVSVPHIYRELSTKRVLVTEWIEGCRVSDVARLEAMKLSRAEVMEVVTRYFAHQLFVTGHLHGDPHTGNLLVRLNPRTSPRLDVVVLDHGLYCDMNEELRKNYADLWVAIMRGDEREVRRVMESWGIRDHELAASLLAIKPPYLNDGDASHARMMPTTLTRKELILLHLQIKERLQNLLSEMSETPPELFLVARNLGLQRSLYIELDAPVNRTKIMAEYAAMGSSTLGNSPIARGRSGWWWSLIFNRAARERLTFTFRMVLMDVLFRTIEFIRRVKLVFFGVDDGGFERVFLERNIMRILGEHFWGGGRDRLSG